MLPPFFLVTIATAWTLSFTRKPRRPTLIRLMSLGAIPAVFLPAMAADGLKLPPPWLDYAVIGCILLSVSLSITSVVLASISGTKHVPRGFAVEASENDTGDDAANDPSRYTQP